MQPQPTDPPTHTDFPADLRRTPRRSSSAAPPPSPGRDTPCVAFVGTSLLARGPLAEVLPHVHAHGGALVFSLRTGAVLDLDLRGSPGEALARLSDTAASCAERGAAGDLGDTPNSASAGAPAVPRGRGRPKLGVVAKEVTLLPRHWRWLRAQPKSASATLRQLVEAQMRASQDTHTQRRDAAYGLMSAVAGDLPGFEEAARALFRGEPMALVGWPEGLRTTLEGMLEGT